MSDELLSHERFCAIEEDLLALEQKAYAILKKALNVQAVCMENTTLLDHACHELHRLKSESEELLCIINRCAQVLA